MCQFNVYRFNSHRPAIGHRVTGVYDQIEDKLLQLRPIAGDWTKVLGECEHERDI